MPDNCTKTIIQGSPERKAGRQRGRALMLLLSLPVAVHINPGQAQVVHRCVGADGKVSYSDSPCSAGVQSAKELQVKTAPASAPSSQEFQPEPAWKVKNAEFEQRRKERLQNEQMERAEELNRQREKRFAEQDAKRREREAAMARVRRPRQPLIVDVQPYIPGAPNGR